MSMFIIFFIFNVIGGFEAWQPELDINRVKLVSVKPTRPNQSYRNQGSNAVGYQYQGSNSVGYQHKRSNDYDDHSGGFSEWGKTVQHVRQSAPPAQGYKVHQPREDPRLFYQSTSYIEENNKKNINRTVSEIYPGREVVRRDEVGSRSLPFRTNDRGTNFVDSDYNICVQCPHDRTMIAKPGSDRVILQSPALSSCSGMKAPREARFSTVYGPKFGSLLEQGSYMIIGRITYKSKILKMCKMQVHVMVHNCPVPNYLIARCDERSKLCKFSCRDSALELRGNTALVCAENEAWAGWSGKLPVCRARSWCMPPSPPDHGHLSCKGTTIDGLGLSEGSTCRVRCARGWHWNPRAATVCRRGNWTYNLTCQPKRRHI